MKCCNTIDTKAVMNGKVSHVNFLINDDLYAWISNGTADALIKLFDNRSNLRRNFLDEFKGPFLKRFCQNRMICVRNQ